MLLLSNQMVFRYPLLVKCCTLQNLRQTLIFLDCNIDGGILAKFDADGEYLDEEVDFTFEDFKMPEKFAALNGML